jgi:hypothetical protein
MVKYAILLSYDNFLFYGVKFQLENENVHLFYYDEMGAFLKLCAGEEINKFIVFYDAEFKKITEAIFHDRPYALVNTELAKEIKIPNILKPSTNMITAYSCANFKSKAMEKTIIYYFFFLKMSYKDISKKLEISEARISHFISNYVKGMNFRNKNEFLIYLNSI